MEKEFKIKSLKFFSNKRFTKFLNYSAAFIIVAIIIVFISEVKSEKPKEESKLEKLVELNLTGNQKVDLDKFNDALDSKLEKFKGDLKDSEKERNENMKYYATLIGFILSIVGFFGFKSIHDTRQVAIEKAVFDAKKEATDVAKKEATGVAKIIAESTVKDEIGQLTEKETINYLDNNLQNHLKQIEKTVIQEFQSRLDEVQNSVDILNHPGNFDNNERPVFYKNTQNAIVDLQNEISKIQKEIYDFKNDELKKNIILELRKDDKS